MLIEYEDFAKLELKVGTILEAAEHPNADKLYVVKVDIGDKQIQIVAGIRLSYSLEDLKDKQVVVVTNLAPKLLRGVSSEGMLLAVQSKQGVCLVVPQKPVDSGSIVK